MEPGEENISRKEPTPLSLEGAPIQMDVDVKPKPANRATAMNFRTQRDIKKVIATPKEQGSGAPSEPLNNGGDTFGGSSSSDASDTIAQARARMNSEPQEPTALSGSNGGGEDLDSEAPDKEECLLYAETIIEAIEFGAVWGLQIYAKDAEETAYVPNPKRKEKMIKLLAKILMRVGKKHPVELYFFLLLLGSYFPVFRKAQIHRTKVLAEKASQALLNEEANKEKDSGSSGKKRRSLKNDSEISDATIED